MSADSERTDPFASLRACRPYFDSGQVVEPSNAFVAWLDVMGASSAMQRSHMIAANFVMKLHAAVLGAPHSDLGLYPVIDGVYIVSDNPQSLLNALADALFRLGIVFLCERKPLYRFIARGAVAFGPVIHGAPYHGNNDQLRQAEDYRRGIVLGLPLTNAYEGERKASPFGVFIHESARLVSQSPLMRSVHWRWWRYGPERTRYGEVARLLRDALQEYYDWCLQHTIDIFYEPDRIRLHRELARQYFAMLLD